MKKKILIVEDEPTSQNLLKGALADLPVEVCIAQDIDTALTTLEREAAVSLIVADVKFPAENGFGHEFQSNDRLKQIPFVLLTAAPSDPRLTMAAELKPKVILTKPLRPEDFKKIVENILF